MNYHILAADDETIMRTVTSRRDAERAARRILGVRRLVHDEPHRDRATGELVDTGWRHASRDEGCASVRIVRVNGLND